MLVNSYLPRMLNLAKLTVSDATAAAATKYISTCLSSFQMKPILFNPVKLEYTIPRISPCLIGAEMIPSVFQQTFFDNFTSDYKLVNSLNECLIDALVDIAISKLVGMPIDKTQITDHFVNQFVRSVVSSYGSKVSAKSNGRTRPNYTDEFIWGIAGSVCGQTLVNYYRGNKLDHQVLKRGVIGGFCRVGYGYVRKFADYGMAVE